MNIPDRDMHTESGRMGMTLRDYLRVPYLVEAALVADGQGGWLREATHPELPSCAARSPHIVQSLDLLDRRRLEVILDLFRRGVLPPSPRPPLPHVDPEGVLLRHDLYDACRSLLDVPVATLVASQGESDADA